MSPSLSRNVMYSKKRFKTSIEGCRLCDEPSPKLAAAIVGFFLLPGAGERLVKSLSRANFWESSLWCVGSIWEPAWCFPYFFFGSGVTSVTSVRLLNCGHLDQTAPSPLSLRSSGYSLIEMPNEVPGVSCRDGAN